MIDIGLILTISGLSGATVLSIGYAIVRLWLKDECIKAMKEEVSDLQKQIDELSKDKQCKEYCTLNHNNIDKRFDGVESMLKSIYDLLLKK